MKRIGIDCRMLGKRQATGIGNYIEQVVKRLITRDTEHDYVLFLKPENQHLIADNLPRVKKVVTDIHWYGWEEQVKFLRVLNREKLDLLHVPQFNVPILYRRPFIVTIHDVTQLLYPGPKRRMSLIRNLAFKAVFGHAVRKSLKIIAVSEYTKLKILEYFRVDTEKISVTYLGIENTYQEAPNYGKINELKLRHGLKKPYLFFTGAWRSHKNFIGLILAFEILKTSYGQDIQLVLGGQEDPRYPDIRRTIEKLPEAIRTDVITTGFISDEDLQHFTKGALAYIIPSFIEGFGLNGLEAMAGQVPVICSKTGSLPEIYGDAAVYFNPSSPEEMAEKIFQTITDPALISQLRLAGDNRIKLYSWDRTAEKTISIYQKALS